MTEQFTPDFSSPLIIGATGLEAIRQNIKIIILTHSFSIPLDRGFAHDGKMIDSPAPMQTARLTAMLTEAIEKYEPRVKVISMEWKKGQPDYAQGILQPVIKFSLKDGVKL